MKLAAIFQDLEHLNDFQTIGYGSHFVFQNEARKLQARTFHGLFLHSETLLAIIKGI